MSDVERIAQIRRRVPGLMHQWYGKDVPFLLAALARRDAAIQAVTVLCERVLSDAKRPVEELRAEGRHLPAVPAMALMAAHVQATIAALDVHGHEGSHDHTWDERDGFCVDAACHAHVNDHGGDDDA